MPVYHSTLNDFPGEKICSTTVLPLKTKIKGPCPPADPSKPDIIDEAIDLFRANVLFKKFQPEGPADLTLVYLTIYIAEVLRLFATQKKKTDAQKKLVELTMKANFSIPGEKDWPLAGFFANPKDRKEQETFRQYYRQLREECGNRLLDVAYLAADGEQNKWWIQFSKRKFLNINSTN